MNHLRILIALLLAGCASDPTPNDWAKATIGVPIDRVIEAEKLPTSYVSRIGWQEKIYDLPNGNWVRVVPLNETCVAHLQVDRTRTIVGSRLEGPGCD